MSTEHEVARGAVGASGEDAPQAEPAPAAPPLAMVPRWVQLVMLPIALLAAWELARASKSVLLVFIVAGVIALVLNPAVAFVQRRGVRRGVAVACVYLAFFLSVAGVVALLATPVSDQVTKFANNLPHLIKQANHTLQGFQDWLNRNGIHVHLIKQGQTALQTLQGKLSKGLGSIASFSGSVLTKVVGVGFDMILILILSIYFLLYGESIGRLTRRIMPPGSGTSDDDYPHAVQRAVSHYVRGQLLFSFIMGATAGVALFIFGLIGIFPQGRSYGFFFAVFYGLMELVPLVGPVLGAVPPLLVALFTHPITALWLALLFLALQQIEGHIVAPQIFARSLRINPLLVIFALLVGGTIYGVVGALMALPVAAIVRTTVVYLERHLVLEPWDRSRPLL